MADDDRAPPAIKQSGRSLKSYIIRKIASLCFGSSGRLGCVRTTAGLCVHHVDTWSDKNATFNKILPRRPPFAAWFEIVTGSANPSKRDKTSQHMPTWLLNGSSGWRQCSQASSPKPNEASNATLIRMYSGGNIPGRGIQICRLSATGRYFVRCCWWNGKLSIQKAPRLSVWTIQSTQCPISYINYPIRWGKTLFSSTCFALSPAREQGTDNPHKTLQITLPQNEHQQWRNTVEDEKQAVIVDIAVLQEYVVRPIMRHVDTSQGRKYVVRWYGYIPGSDSLKPPHYNIHALYQAVLEPPKSQTPTRNALLTNRTVPRGAETILIKSKE